MDRSEITAAIQEAVSAQGGKPYTIERKSGLPEDAIRNVLNGREPGTFRMAAICDALGLEFYIGPRRDGAAPLAAHREPLEPDVASDALPAWAQSLLEDVAELRREREQWRFQPTLAVLKMPGMAPVGVIRHKAAAGHGSPDSSATPDGVVYFPEHWLEQRDIDPTICTVMRVYGDSMEPTLPDGCSILVDRSRREIEDGRIFVCRPEMGLIVKRAKLDRGRWLLISDNPVWPPIEPHPQTTEIYGEVRWTSRTFW